VKSDFVDMVEKRERERVEGLGFDHDMEIGALVRQATGLKPPQVARGFVWDNDLPTALTAPLFYDQSLVVVCRHCEITSDLGLLKWMGERNLIVPVLNGCYHNFAPEAVAVLAGLTHVSRFAFFEVQQAWANKEGLGCLCAECTKERLTDYSGLPAESKDLVEGFYISRLTELPTKVRETVLPHINGLIATGDTKALEAETSGVESMVMLSRARSINAIPQFRFLQASPQESSVSPEAKYLALTLGILYSPSMPAREYLEVIADYKGSLSFLVDDTSPPSLGRAMDKVSKINSEIKEMRGSRRYKLYHLGTRVVRRNRRVVIEALIGGALGMLTTGPIGAVAGAGIVLGAEAGATEAIEAAANRASKSRLSHVVAARFFGKSLPAIQVWRVEEALKTRTDKS